MGIFKNRKTTNFLNIHSSCLELWSSKQYFMSPNTVLLSTIMCALESPTVWSSVVLPSEASAILSSDSELRLLKWAGKMQMFMNWSQGRGEDLAPSFVCSQRWWLQALTHEFWCFSTDF
jgi:hypothetical protein